MLIKHKLTLNTGIFVVSMVVMLGMLTFSSASFERNIEVARGIGEVESGVLELRRNEKNFMVRKELEYAQAFKQKYGIVIATIEQLIRDYEASGLDNSDVKKVATVVKQYKQLFEQLVASQQAIGLHPKDALYGELRKAVHNVETLIGRSDFQILSGMLQLRRNEKDFMLRLDEKYVTRLQANVAKLVQDIEQSKLSSDKKSQITALLTSYEKAFLNLTSEQKKLGLSYTEGLQGQMRQVVGQVDAALDVMVKTSASEVEAYTNSLALLSNSVFFIVLVFSGLFTRRLSKGIQNNIDNLHDTMVEISKTDDLTITVDTSGKDELGEMAHAFQEMLDGFKRLIGEVNQSVTTLNDATASVSDNISKTNEGVDSQIQETDLVATAVTEMVATVDEIANNTQEAASKAEQTNLNAEVGKKGVQSTIEQIDSLTGTLHESEQVVQELAKDSETIGSVLDVIRGIAEQTNLLALNAAIEAARAGEQGRGFAVVADEVRTLASRTQESTQEIEGIISSLQGRTQDIVSRMAKCRTQGDESATQAGEAGVMLDEITQDVATIMDMSTAIATAIQQQSVVASEVNKHVISIRDVAEQSGEMSMQNGKMSEELSEQAQILKQEVQKFKVN